MVSRRRLAIPQGVAVPPQPFPGYVLRFFDGFTSFGGNPSGSNDWSTTYLPDQDRTLGGNAELECYCDATVGATQNPFSIVPGGKGLRITASLSSITGANPLGATYNSGVITSATTFAMQYGYFEYRAKLPAGKGLWTAGWTRQPAGFVSSAEIDGFEQTGVPTNIYNNVHYGTTGSPIQTGPQLTTVADTSAGYHIYSFDWDPNNITFYFDRNFSSPTYTVPTPAGLNVAFSFVLDFAVGGTFPGNPDGTTVFPAFFDIDYCAAWSNLYSTNISGTRAIP